MKTFNETQSAVFSHIDGHIEEALWVQEQEPTLGDITPTLRQIRDDLSTIKTVDEFKILAEEEKKNNEILFKVYRATSNEEGLGDTDYSHTISDGIVKEILD